MCRCPCKQIAVNWEVTFSETMTKSPLLDMNNECEIGT